MSVLYFRIRLFLKLHNKCAKGGEGKGGGGEGRGGGGGESEGRIQKGRGLD
jgi:hypothetical protein